MMLVDFGHPLLQRFRSDSMDVFVVSCTSLQEDEANLHWLGGTGTCAG